MGVDPLDERRVGQQVARFIEVPVGDGQQTGQRARCSGGPVRPGVTGVSPRPGDQRGARKLGNTRVKQGVLFLLHSDGTIERLPRDLDWPGARTTQRSCASSDS